MKYTVTVEENSTRFVEIEVEANSHEEATKIVQCRIETEYKQPNWSDWHNGQYEYVLTERSE